LDLCHPDSVSKPLVYQTRAFATENSGSNFSIISSSFWLNELEFNFSIQHNLHKGNNMKKNTTALVRKANKALVLTTIKDNEPITLEDVLKITNLSRPTAHTIIKELMDDKLVYKHGYAESSGGRMPILYCFNATAHYAIGVDFEFPPVRLIISDLKGKLIHSKGWVFSRNVSKEKVIDDLLHGIEEIIIDSGISKEKFIGIGVGLPGIIDYEKGLSKNIERIANWHNVNIKEILQKRLELPVYIRNDVHLLGLIEKELYQGVNMSNFIYIGIRAGTGMAIFINDTFFKGMMGNAGFLGHTIVESEGPNCTCGNKGCLETYTSELAIVRRYLEAANLGFSEENDNLSVSDIIEKANENDPLAIEILESSGQYLGIAISNLIKILEIPTVIIGGLVDTKKQIFLNSVIQEANKNLLNYSIDTPFIIKGSLTHESFALGGCLLVIDNFNKAPFLRVHI
jgi:predicted NBD/HSP70 family sugar kinase